jgi:phosphohistidine phosphatase
VARERIESGARRHPVRPHRAKKTLPIVDAPCFTRLMKLYVMRHGPAEDQAESGLDADRALTASGRERVRAVAKALADEHEAPLTIFTSPYVRCVQTAEIIAIATKVAERGGRVEAKRDLAPGGDITRIASVLAKNHEPRVLLCGHEPDVSHVVSHLLGKRLEIPFQKAMVIALQIRDAGESRLRFILDPKSLTMDPDARKPDRKLG